MTSPNLQPHTLRGRRDIQAIGCVAGALIAGYELLEPDGFAATFWSRYALVLVGAFFLLPCAAGLALGRPKLAFDEGGLWHATLLRARYLRWDSLGPFAVGFPDRRGFSRTLYACANPVRSKHPLDTIPAHLVHYHANIRIKLADFDAGRNRDNADALVAELNAWRDRYGGGEGSTPTDQ